MNPKDQQLILDLYRDSLECQDGDFFEKYDEHVDLILKCAVNWVNHNKKPITKKLHAIEDTNTGEIKIFKDQKSQHRYMFQNVVKNPSLQFYDLEF